MSNQYDDDNEVYDADFAEISETSCSLETPPKSTRTFFISHLSKGFLTNKSIYIITYLLFSQINIYGKHI